MFIKCSDIVKNFQLRIIGNSEAQIEGIGSLHRDGPKLLKWAKSIERLKDIHEGVVLTSEIMFSSIKPNPDVTYLTCDTNTRLVFAKIIKKYFDFNDELYFDNCVDKHRSNNQIKIGEFVFIGDNVKIGEGTQIHNNVVIHSNTVIGKNCIIKDLTSIGTEGLSHDFDEETQRYIKLPQIGGVILEDFVEVGPNSTIRRSALDDTFIGSGTKIGSLCNIGHNTIIESNCTLISHVVTSGSSKIGSNTFIGVGATIKNAINVGGNSTIGQGAVVVKNVPEGETWVGNPAKKLK
jgi:UDP-3-O-[3-hydroxymyristoyl] glucosamine N-acyltransferase